MELPFFTPAGPLRWLEIAEKLLSARDLMGSKSFATRARDADPTLSAAEEILAVVDTLLAGDSRIGNNQPDWYAILRLTPQQGRDAALVADQYRRLVHILNPQTNRFPFSEQAFRLVFEAWSVLANPSRKSMYDKGLAYYLQQQQQQYQHQQEPFNEPITSLPQNFIFFGGAGTASSVAPPQGHGGQSSSIGLSNYPQVQQVRTQSQVQQVHTQSQVQQVHAQPRVEPIVGGSTREPQNFMNFSSNLVFGSSSGSKPSYEPANNQAEESYSTFSGNAASPSGATQDQCNNKQKQSQQSYADVCDKIFEDDMNVSENASETIEEEEDEERIDVEENEEEEEEEEIVASPVDEDDGETIWTACPYCYYIYEYPSMYADCALRCQNCKKAFQAVVIPSPPPTLDGQEAYFCCWGFMPFGFSKKNWEKNKASASSWTPFSSSMFNHPRKVVNKRVYVDDDNEDDEVFQISSSDESDDDWRSGRKKTKKKKKARNVKRKVTSDKGKNVRTQDSVVSPPKVEVAANVRKPPVRAAKKFEKLDLNVEFSNSEVEEPARRRGEDDNIGFFEGLDEFLSSLPILNVVGDDKTVKATE